MGLFDNIFLDQDSPTAMLEPIEKTKDKPQKATEEAKVSDITKATPDITSEEQPMETVSFDDVGTLTESSVTPSPSGFLSGGTPDMGTSDEVSFDIGGLDIGGLDDSTASDLSLGAISSQETVIDSSSTEELSGDSSIAMVQGATLATSDTIMETPDTTGEIVVSTEEAISDIALAQEPTTLVSHAEQSPDAMEIMSITGNMDTDNTLDGGILGMLGDTTSVVEDTPAILAEDNTAEDAGTISLTDIGEEVITHSDAGTTVSSLGSMDTATGDIAKDVFQDPIESLVSYASSGGTGSALHDMLIEFIQKLETFNQESASLDLEMTDTQESLAQEEDDLKKEYEVRMSAIDYKRKHMEKTREDRRKEKTRLERIIGSLRKELET